MRFSNVTRFALAGAFLHVLAPSRAAAQQKGFAIDRFDPADRGSAWFAADSLDFRGHLRPAIGVVGSWADEPLVAATPAGDRAIVDKQVVVHAGASLVFSERVRAGLSVPAVLHQGGERVDAAGKTFLPPASAGGDMRLTADVRLFGRHREAITGAAGLAVYLPTGRRVNYTGDGNVRVTPRFGIAGDLSVFTYALRVGYAYRALDERFDRSHDLGSEITVAAAAGLRLAQGALVLGPELFGSTILRESSFLSDRGTPVELAFGAHGSLGELRIGGGVGTGLTGGWGSPGVRGLVSLEWAPGHEDDPDHDGVPGGADACPGQSGVRTDDPRTNGCPAAPAAAPADRDRDGIADAVDGCPDVAGAPNADARKHGCPADRDGDGVDDAADACPDVPGVRGSDPKRNGCPADRDGDGVADDKDACPDLRGAVSDDALRNGCPADRDGDGVYDPEDACPDAAGPADPSPKRTGCPLARLEGGQIKILRPVRFVPGAAAITKDSDPTLLAIATMLKAHPELARIRVEGHTDDRDEAKVAVALGQRRADAVVKWLTGYGIERNRLEAKSLGGSRPIEANDTEEGRDANRRVEFHVVTTR